MNANRFSSVLACALVAGLATSAAVAKNAAAAEQHRADRQERQEQRQEQRPEQRREQGAQQGGRQDQRYANNPPPRSAPPNAAPPAAAPRQRPPTAAPSGGGQRNGPPREGAQRDGGRGNYVGRGNGGSYNRGGSNDNRVVTGPPRGNGGGSSHNSPPPRHYNSPGNGHSPGHGNSGYRHPPRYVSHLPSGYHRHYWNGNPYYYHGGHWYRPYGSQYVVVGAPYGLYVPYLPYYSSFWFGSSRYFYSDGIYYNYEPVRRGYVVTQSPYEEEGAATSDVTDEDLYIYPAQGQSAEQQADDKYECHSWAVEQTQYDPVDSDYDANRRSDYIRAITACLTGRGYTVR